MSAPIKPAERLPTEELARMRGRFEFWLSEARKLWAHIDALTAENEGLRAAAASAADDDVDPGPGLYRAVGIVCGSKSLGVVYATSAADARERALNGDNAHVSLCHQCDEECEDPEVEDVVVDFIREFRDGEGVATPCEE